MVINSAQTNFIIYKVTYIRPGIAARARIITAVSWPFTVAAVKIPQKPVITCSIGVACAKMWELYTALYFACQL